VHRQVIENLGRHEHEVFARLRDAAAAGRDAVVARDLDAFGQAMIANTDAQRCLHAELVGADATRVIDVATAHGAIGWKVNGAGGEGGSLTILSATREAKAALERRVSALDPRYQVLPIQISTHGLQIRGAL
jgi:D-glycero-alpha-D-manno-heptose-7-phosphate kinase